MDVENSHSLIRITSIPYGLISLNIKPITNLTPSTKRFLVKYCATCDHNCALSSYFDDSLIVNLFLEWLVIVVIPLILSLDYSTVLDVNLHTVKNSREGSMFVAN